MTDTRPFAGLAVVDLAWVVAGPAIGRTLADYGATVVRVESSRRVDAARLIGPHRDGRADPQRCALFDTYNAGKLGLALDLATPAGRDVLRDLAGWADVLVESFAPGQLDRWGLAPGALRAANPRLIGVSTSLMGQTGPMKSFAGYGNLGAAIAGYQGLAGREGEVPVGPFGPYTDFVAPRFALVALLAALDHRRRTGEGCWLDISQAEAGIQFLGAAVAHGAATGAPARAIGNRDPQFAPHAVYRCAGDDTWVAIVARSDREWARFAALIGDAALAPRWHTFANRKADESRLDAIVEAWTRTRDATEVERALQSIGVPAHRVAASADVVADPQLAACGHFVRMSHPLGGECVFDASRYRLSATPAAYERPAPHFGRDTEHVLSDLLGYPRDRIAALQAQGVLS